MFKYRVIKRNPEITFCIDLSTLWLFLIICALLSESDATQWPIQLEAGYI